MNKIKSLLVIGILTAAFAVGAQTTQTNASGGINTITGPIDNLEVWATSYNPSNNIAATKFDLTTGTREITGASGVGNVVAFRAYIHTNYVVGFVGAFGAAGTAFNGAEGELAYRFYHKYDFALDAGALAGYDGLAKDAKGHSGAIEVEPELVASKLMTATSIARLRITKPVESVGKGNGNIGIYAELGFAFP